MSRVSRSPATRRRRKRYLKQAKGYVGGRRKLYKTARESVERGMQYAYRDRRRKKRDFRRLWISRINAAARRHDMSYSQLIHALNTSGIELNRKVLADLAVRPLEEAVDVFRQAALPVDARAEGHLERPAPLEALGQGLAVRLVDPEPGHGQGRVVVRAAQPARR